MNKKRTMLLYGIMLSLFVHAGLAGAFEVAVLKSADIRPYNEALDGFESSCGCSLHEIQYQKGDLAAQLSDIKADLILAIGADALKHAQSIKSIPVIYTVIPSPPPLAPEQKNVTGVTMYISPDKYFTAIEDIFPNAARIGILYDPKNNDGYIKEALQAARSRGIDIVLKTIKTPEEVPAMLTSMKEKIDIFLMLPDITVVTPETVKLMLLFSFENRVPIFTFSRKYLEAGATAGLTIVPFDMGEQAGEMAKRVSTAQKGFVPPRMYPRKTLMMINRKVVKRLDLQIRDEVLKKAEEVE